MPTQVRILPPPYEWPRRSGDCNRRGRWWAWAAGCRSARGGWRHRRRDGSRPGAARLGRCGPRHLRRALGRPRRRPARRGRRARLVRGAGRALRAGRRARPPGRRLARRKAAARGAALRLGPPPQPARPHRPAHHARLSRPAGGERARPLRPRLRQAGPIADDHERCLRGREGRRGGLDPRPRRRFRRRRRHRQHRHRRRDPDAANAGGEPGQGLPHVHSRRAPGRGDRLPLLGRCRKDERPAIATYHGRVSRPPKRPKAPDGKMTIGELARRTGMTVRNIRAHQTRGLLPPPEVHGRTGYYNEDHVARIELTREMQAEGLNLEAIPRVLESADGSSAEIVDFARAVRAPFEDETPEIFSAAELAELWGAERLDPKLVRHGEKLGILRELPDGKVEVISPRLQRAGGALVELGVSPEAALATADKRHRQAEGVPRAF